jgi:hypothetical protein
MLPVVDRLEKEYSKRVEFRYIDADSADGNAVFRAYQLIGHPSYVLLTPEGNVLWKGQGEQDYQELEGNLSSALAAVEP